MKSFNEKYRQLLSQDASTAPEDVWENIALQLDIDAAEMRLNAEDKELVDAVWAGIEEQLDVDEVWGSISSELDKAEQKTTRFKLPYWMAAAVLLLLFLIGDSSLVPFQKDSTAPQYMADVQTEQEQDSEMPMAEGIKDGDEAIGDRPDEDNTTAFSKNVAAQTKSGNENPPDRIVPQPPIEPADMAPGEINNSYLARKEALVNWQQELRPEPELELFDLKPMNDYSAEDLDYTFPTNETYGLLAHNKTYSRWSTGVVTTIKNTYLINAETKDGFSPSGMNASEITVLPDFGLNVQYAMSRRYTLSSNLFLSSSLKQNSNTYKYGEYVSKQSKLNYLAAEFAVKQRSKYNFFDADKAIRRNILGFYVAGLQSASETLANVKTDMASKYTALDYGVLVGQEVEFVSSGPIKVSAGLTAKYGLPNVYAGDNSLPGNMNQTHNTSFEFRIRIDYHWKINKDFDSVLSFLSMK